MMRGVIGVWVVSADAGLIDGNAVLFTGGDDDSDGGVGGGAA